MKRGLIFKIVILIIAILVVASLFYKFYQIKSFRNDLRPVTEAEKQKIMNILNEEFNTTGYEIIFGNVFTDENETLVQVQLKDGNSKKTYLINLRNESLVRKYNEQ